MQISNHHRIAIIVIVLALNIYAITEAIISGSFKGVLFALGSLCALAYCNHLLKKLKELETADDETV